MYTISYFDLTCVDKFQQCLDLFVYKFLLWFDLCIQRDTVIWPQKKAENWWKTVDNFLHWFQISVYNCPSCFSSRNYTPSYTILYPPHNNIPIAMTPITINTIKMIPIYISIVSLLTRKRIDKGTEILTAPKLSSLFYSVM